MLNVAILGRDYILKKLYLFSWAMNFAVFADL